MRTIASSTRTRAAAGASLRTDLKDELSVVVEDPAIDWRVRLEAAVSLARLDGDRWGHMIVDFEWPTWLPSMSYKQMTRRSHRGSGARRR